MREPIEESEVASRELALFHAEVEIVRLTGGHEGTDGYVHVGVPASRTSFWRVVDRVHIREAT
eukprot:1672193-Prymnesium_polylepis.1